MRSMVVPVIVLGSFLAAGSASAARDVPVPHFDGIGLTGGGKVVVKYGAVQRVTLIKGNTQYTTIEVQHGQSLHIEACNSQCPNHYDLEIEIVTPDIQALAVKGGGQISTAAGFPRQGTISVAVNGGGGINLRNVTADQVNAAVNGGGGIAVRAERSLNAAVNGGGGITYWGNPQVMQVVRGGGAVSHGS